MSYTSESESYSSSNYQYSFTSIVQSQRQSNGSSPNTTNTTSRKSDYQPGTSIRRGTATSADDRSKYCVMKDGRWDNMDLCMRSYGLKMSNHEDVKEAQAILDSLRRHDVAKLPKVNTKHIMPGSYEDEEDGDDGDYIQSNSSDDMISQTRFVSGPAHVRRDEVHGNGNIDVLTDEHDDDNDDDDGAIATCDQDDGDMISGNNRFGGYNTGGHDFNPGYDDGENDDYPDNGGYNYAVGYTDGYGDGFGDGYDDW
ncbi:uncharacterized protein BDR25DRAFT_345182 [Lindgomyces ingoldianus]|uniref:Uncharacterized protein n=1 Tax=Lindgomyces ingoldianus TaxID=673940 RepID=A0ACB6QJC0_9PLEO|nr:uncharacterized protein BDR25DRAFT_345182 [Lindgomyces ingoldianus]KAF2466995.1 hypothetical protein BDR25DRAFT_345182 [Lindgomyces ingoldianus]